MNHRFKRAITAGALCGMVTFGLTLTPASSVDPTPDQWWLSTNWPAIEPIKNQEFKNGAKGWRVAGSKVKASKNKTSQLKTVNKSKKNFQIATIKDVRAVPGGATFIVNAKAKVTRNATGLLQLDERRNGKTVKTHNYKINFKKNKWVNATTDFTLTQRSSLRVRLKVNRPNGGRIHLERIKLKAVYAAGDKRINRNWLNEWAWMEKRQKAFAKSLLPRATYWQKKNNAAWQAYEATKTPAPVPPTEPASCTADKNWTPHLNEEFDSLNSKIWNVRNDSYLNHEDSYLLARNVTVKNSKLKIQAKKENYKHRSYTSGYVDTNSKYSVPSYFRAEVRAKVPFEQGMWSAPLWFRPVGKPAGEIDLVETYGRDKAEPSVHQTIHTEYGATHRQSVKEILFSDLTGDATGWHTYTMEKVPGKITMWVDCIKTSEFSNKRPTWYSEYYDTNDRWNLRVNVQVGGKWGKLPDKTTDWTPDKTAMEIDYIKTWVPTN